MASQSSNIGQKRSLPAGANEELPSTQTMTDDSPTAVPVEPATPTLPPAAPTNPDRLASMETLLSQLVQSQQSLATSMASIDVMRPP